MSSDSPACAWSRLRQESRNRQDGALTTKKRTSAETLIKQRKTPSSNSPRADVRKWPKKEAAEIKLIELTSQSRGEEDIVAGVKAVIAEMGAPTMKIGDGDEDVMSRFSAAGMRVEGKQVSEAVKRELTPIGLRYCENRTTGCGAPGVVHLNFPVRLLRNVAVIWYRSPPRRLWLSLRPNGHLVAP